VRTAAILWLLVVATAAAYLGFRVVEGVQLRTDLLALLPQEDRDPAVQRAKERVAAAFGRRIIVLVGHEDRATARTAGARLAEWLGASPMVRSVTHALHADAVRDLGQALFPFRAGLLAASDRARLEAGRGAEIVQRALATVYGPAGIADARLLQADPFLLLPNFFAELPPPLGRVAPDEGVLSVPDGGRTWVFIAAQLEGDVFALDFQARFAGFFEGLEARIRAETSGLEVLRTGAVFYAERAASQANRETSRIGVASLAATATLILVVFRAALPLVHNILAMGIGILVAFAASLFLFGELHVGALLFGVSLIGIAVDYSLHYSCERFSRTPTPPRERLRHVLPSIALGALTTIVGYMTLFFAPFPGLHQVAAFSAFGVAASFLTVVLWLPLLDRGGSGPHGGRMLAAADRLWLLWEAPGHRRTRLLLGALLLLGATLGAVRFTVDDDIRRMQSLSTELKPQETEIQRLTGISSAGFFFLVRGATAEAALQAEEMLLPRLRRAQEEGALAQYQAVAHYIPSTARQQADRTLVEQRLLRPYRDRYYAQLGFTAEPAEAPAASGVLTLADFLRSRAGDAVRDLVLDETTHIVVLNGVVRPAAVQALATGIPGVALIDPTGDVTRLLGAYRGRAVLLLIASAALMLPLLAWRYGLGGSLRVLLPSTLALALAPLLLAAVGLPFTFFSAMALVLVLSMGIDYAIFCREGAVGRRSVTMLGVGLATATTLLSFGLLTLSSAFAVHAFGATMLVGIALSFMLAPLAGKKN
jgi:predicted exporter